ncbi:MAG: PDZ domain-containing protein [Anaerolineae bacterium]|nr:MAG: PDZ domain-containing protein [Anaerolineae bacterium]
MRRTIFSALLVLLAMVAAFAAGYLVHATRHPAGDFPLLEEAYHALQKYGLYDTPAVKDLTYGAIHGMLQVYGDPYTIFVEPSQNELQNDRLAGEFGGIGVTLEQLKDGSIVLHPIAGGPAESAGVQDGDRLIQVDDLHTFDSLESAQAALRGPVDTQVHLVLLRPPAWQRVEVSIQRRMFNLPSVTWHLDPAEPRLGVVAVNRMAATTSEEILQAITLLSERGATHFALDLRDNGGGLLDSGVESARLFLSQGTIVEQQYRGKAVESISVTEPGPLVSLPLVVFVNHGTASAAELLAGALQAQQRAPLIGTSTYGKDTLQLLLPLSDGSSLHVTAARWWVPGLAHPIGEGGLQPDIPLQSPDANAWLQAARAYFFPADAK